MVIRYKLGREFHLMKMGARFFTGCLIFDKTQKQFECFGLRVYTWPGDQLYSVFTDCIAICYRTQLTPTKNISKAFERTPFIVGKTLQSDSCMSKSKEQIWSNGVSQKKSIQNKGQMRQP